MYAGSGANCRAFSRREFFFQPADIVSQILNFGLPAPVDIQIIGADMRTNYDDRPRGSRIGCADSRGGRCPRATNVSLPTLHLDMDRTRINQVGLTAQNVAQSVLISLSGSFQTAPNFWLNPRTA